MSKRLVEKLGRKNKFSVCSVFKRFAVEWFSPSTFLFFFFEKRVKNHINEENEKLTYFKKVEGG